MTMPLEHTSHRLPPHAGDWAEEFYARGGMVPTAGTRGSCSNGWRAARADSTRPYARPGRGMGGRSESGGVRPVLATALGSARVAPSAHHSDYAAGRSALDGRELQLAGSGRGHRAR